MPLKMARLLARTAEFELKTTKGPSLRSKVAVFVGFLVERVLDFTEELNASPVASRNLVSEDHIRLVRSVKDEQSIASTEYRRDVIAAPRTIRKWNENAFQPTA